MISSELKLFTNRTFFDMLVPKLLAIVPARLGSKRVPQKNIRMLGDKPLIHHTLEGAVRSKIFNKVMVTTESTQIRDVALDTYGVEVPWLRPKALAGDKSNVMDSIFHSIEEYRKVGEEFDGIALLQPTSPMRTLQTIKEAVRLFSEHNYDNAVVSMSCLREPLEWAFREQGESIVPVFGWDAFRKRSQELQEFWTLNGLIYLASPDTLLTFGSFINSKMLILKTNNNIESMDIDTEEDWSEVEDNLKKRMDH